MISKILVTRADRIGDLVLSTPVFKALKQKFPHAHLSCLTFLENRELVQGNPYLDEVILYDKRGSEKGVWGNLRFAAQIKKKKFDLVIHLHATNRMHWVSFLAGIPTRIGWNRKLGWALTEAYPDHKVQGLKHEAEYNFDLLKSLEVPIPSEFETHFPLNGDALTSLQKLFDQKNISLKAPKLILAPSASCLSKIWPAERFAAVADAIYEQTQLPIFLVGSRRDRVMISKVAELASAPVINLSGKLSLSMTGWLLKTATLLISNDSGPVHIATAVGTPVISIFGRKQPGLSPTRWKPLSPKAHYLWKDVGCDPCLAHQCEIHFLCLDAISKDEVMQVADVFLKPYQRVKQEVSPA